MTVPIKVSADAGTPLVISTSNPTVLLQGTCGSARGFRTKRFELRSNNPGASQQILQLQLVTYATATAGGTTVTATPKDQALNGVYTPTTTFKANTTTLGTTPTVVKSWLWNTANIEDQVDGLVELQEEFTAGKVFAFIFPTAPGASLSVTATLHGEEGLG
jgi:hypothetical protein